MRSRYLLRSKCWRMREMAESASRCRSDDNYFNQTCTRLRILMYICIYIYYDIKSFDCILYDLLNRHVQNMMLVLNFFSHVSFCIQYRKVCTIVLQTNIYILRFPISNISNHYISYGL